ncbi:MAG: LytTR family DNA-binding domain-containing protein [Spirosomataceae bacterium]
MTLTCVIVDDELMARKALERLCEKRNELEVAAVCADAEEALQILQSREIDLLFLDIELPGLNGLQLLDRLPYMPVVIMTTSKTEYAYDAFQYQVHDYLKKPITLPRFMQTIDKVVEHLNTASKFVVTPKNESNDIFVKEEGRYIRLAYQDILYIENVGDYAKIKTHQGSHVIYTTMKTLEEKLPTSIFFRVHRSFIINLSKIVDIEESNLVVDDKVIPISRANKPELMERINLL